MRVARFRSVSPSGYYRVLAEEDVQRMPAVYGPKEFVRISDWIDVYFPPRTGAEAAKEELDALDAAESSTRAKFQADLDRICADRAKLTGRLS